MKRIWSVLALGAWLFLAGAAFASPSWIGVTPGARANDAAAALVSTDLNRTVFTIDVPGLVLERVAGPTSEAFVRVSIPGAGVNNRIGEPSLPVLRELVRVPFGADVEVQVTGVRFRTIDLAQEGYSLPVWPQQPPIEKRPGARQRAAFVRDGAAYSAAEYRDELVRIEDEGVIRGTRFVTVAVSPVSYEAKTGRLRVATDFTVTVATPAARRAVRSFAPRAALADPLFGEMTGRTFLNGRAAAEGTKALPAVPIGYLVITNSAFAADPSLQALVQHRTERGFDVTVATTNTIGTTKEQIKAYIQNAYDTWPRPPAFILLVGDTNVIPYWVSGTTDNPSTDLNYTLLQGADYFPDAFIGRISVADATQLANVVDKTLSVENLELSPYDWILRATFMASSDNYTVSEGTHNFVVSTYMDPAGFTSHKRYSYTYNATPAQVTGDVNAGLSELTYSGHGDTTYWADGPVYYQSDVQALTNAAYPFVQSYACLTGQFEAGECFGETWIRVAHGAVAYMGSSVTSYWDEDDILERGLYESFYANPDGDDLTWLGGMMDRGKMVLYNHYGGSGNTERYFNEYNILGDAAVDLWNGTPAPLAPTYPPILFIGATQITVETGVANAVAAVSKDGALYGAGRANAGGTAVVTFDDPITEPGTYKLVVWAHNRVPFSASLPAQAASSDGTVTLDREVYGGHDVANVMVTDLDLAGHGTQVVTAKSDTTPGGVQVTLNELGTSGAFSGSVNTTTGKAALPVSDGDTLTVVYVDADDGHGHHNVSKTATARIDAAGPDFAGLDTATGGDQTVTLAWTAGTDASLPITYLIYRANASGAENFAAPIATTTEVGYVDTGLQNYATYYYVVRAADALGNQESNTVERPGRPIGPVPIWIEDFEHKDLSDWTIQDLNGDGRTWTDANPNGHSSSYLDTTFAVCDNAGFLNTSNDVMTGPTVDATGYVSLDLRFGQSFLKTSTVGNPETGTVETTAGSSWDAVTSVQATTEGYSRFPLAASYDNAAAFQVRFTYTNTNPFSSGYWGVDDIALYGTPTGPPQAAFSGNPRSGAAPLEVSFINESTGTYTGCAWDFGDGNTGEGDGPVHVYEAPGLYTVSMTATGAGDTSDTETKDGYIEVTQGGDDTSDDTSGDDDTGGGNGSGGGYKAKSGCGC